MPRSFFAPRLLALPFMAVSLAMLTWSLFRAQAAWQFFAAETITQNMYTAKSFPAAGLEDATARLDIALMRFPRNPDFLALGGQLKELEANQPGVLGAEQRALLESAAGHYRRALSVRPLWPYSWANLLTVKDKLGEVDAEFDRALHRAVETGPWEPRVQLQVIRSGMRHWDELNGAARDQVRETMRKALRVQPREAFELARFYARPELVCGQAGNQPQIEQWCARVQPANGPG